MPSTFIWCVNTETQGGGSFVTNEAQFGDGYSQAAADGLNNETQEWPVTIVGQGAEVAAPLAFIRAHKGATSFYWTPPLGVQGLYRCTAYSLLPHGNEVYTLTATFVQNFQP